MHYPVRDNRGESGLQSAAARLLIQLFTDHLHRDRRTALIGSNQFFYYKRGDPHAVVCPELYIIDDETLRQEDISVLWPTHAEREAADPNGDVWTHSERAARARAEAEAELTRAELARLRGA